MKRIMRTIGAAVAAGVLGLGAAGAARAEVWAFLAACDAVLAARLGAEVTRAPAEVEVGAATRADFTGEAFPEKASFVAGWSAENPEAAAIFARVAGLWRPGMEMARAELDWQAGGRRGRSVCTYVQIPPVLAEVTPGLVMVDGFTAAQWQARQVRAAAGGG